MISITQPFLKLTKNMDKSVAIGIAHIYIISKEESVNNRRKIPIQNHRNRNFKLRRIGILRFEMYPTNIIVA